MNTFLSEKLIQALGWTLLHSLWQVTLAGFIFYLIVSLKKRVNASFRYGAATAILALIASIAIFTFSYKYLQIRPEKGNTGLVENLIANSFFSQYGQPASLYPPAKAEEAKPPLLSFLAVNHMVESYIPTIVSGWILGVVLLFIRLLGGLTLTRRLKYHPGNIPLPHWQEKIQTLAQSIQMHKSIRVMISGIARCPMVIGHLKPVILLPASLLTSLPPEQLEAVLAHELAHIHRKDYWVNILQSLVEIIFFYHPVIWWISSVIRTERENCCDDLAVHLCGSTLTYAKALTHIEERRQHFTEFAMTISGKKGTLLQRIERLVNPHSSSSSFSSKYTPVILSFFFLVIIATGTGMAFKAYDLKGEEDLVNKQIPNINTDNQSVAKMTNGGILYRSSNLKPEKEAKLKESYPEVGKSSSMAGISLADTVPPKAKEEKESFTFHIDLDTLPPPQVFTFSDSTLKFHPGQLDSIHGWQDSAIQKHIRKAMKHIEKNLKKIHLQIEDSLAAIDFSRLQKEMANNKKVLLKQSEILARQAAEEFRKRAEALERKAEELEAKAEAKARDKGKSFDQATRKLEKELLQEGLIKKDKKYKFEITDNYLKINGKKQPREVYEKYADLLAREMNIKLEKGNKFSLIKTPY